MEIFLGIVLIIATAVVFFGSCFSSMVCPLWIYIIGQLACSAIAVATYFVYLPLWITIITAVAFVANLVARILSENWSGHSVTFAMIGLGSNIAAIAGCFVNA